MMGWWAQVLLAVCWRRFVLCGLSIYPAFRGYLATDGYRLCLIGTEGLIYSVSFAFPPLSYEGEFQVGDFSKSVS